MTKTLNDHVLGRYKELLTEETDIKDHLPTLFQHAKGFVVELGVRTGNSTTALLAGVIERGGLLYSVDIEHLIHTLFFRYHDQFRMFLADSVGSWATISSWKDIDLLFLDTLHTYDHVLRELEIWGPRVKKGGTIMVHDVLTFPGAGQAVHDWSMANSHIYRVQPGSNGLGIIYV